MSIDRQNSFVFPFRTPDSEGEVVEQINPVMGAFNKAYEFLNADESPAWIKEILADANKLSDEGKLSLLFLGGEMHPISAFAVDHTNNGRHFVAIDMDPRLVDEVLNPDGSVRENDPPQGLINVMNAIGSSVRKIHEIEARREPFMTFDEWQQGLRLIQIEQHMEGLNQ